MNKILRLCFVALLLFAASASFAQDWVKMMQDPSVNFCDVQKAYNKWYRKSGKEIDREHRREQKELGKHPIAPSLKGQPVPEGPVANEEEDSQEGSWMLYKRWENFIEPRVYPTGDRTQIAAAFKQYYDDNYAGASAMKGGALL